MYLPSLFEQHDRAMVPEAMRAPGRASLIGDALLKGLTAIHEFDYAARWRGLGEGIQLKMLAGRMTRLGL